MQVKLPSLAILVRNAAQDVAWMSNLNEQCRARGDLAPKKYPLKCLLRKGVSGKQIPTGASSCLEGSMDDCTIKTDVLSQTSMVNYFEC